MTLNVKRLDDIDMVELPEILARTEMPDTAPLWDDLKKARLIDSILNNIPIGQIFLMRQPRQIVSPDGRLQEFSLSTATSDSMPLRTLSTENFCWRATSSSSRMSSSKRAECRLLN